MCGIDSAFIMCTFCIIKFLFKCDILFQQFLSFKCPQFDIRIAQTIYIVKMPRIIVFLSLFQEYVLLIWKSPDCQFVPYPVSVSLPLQESLIPKGRKSPLLTNLFNHFLQYFHTLCSSHFP